MARMDAYISPLTGDYAGTRTDTLANTVYLRLMTPLGSWWADPGLGSRLHELMREPGAVISREQFEERLYSWGEEVESNAVQVHIHNLRKKLGQKVIVTMRGVGYFMPQEQE